MQSTQRNLGSLTFSFASLAVLLATSLLVSACGGASTGEMHQPRGSQDNPDPTPEPPSTPPPTTPALALPTPRAGGL